MHKLLLAETALVAVLVFPHSIVAQQLTATELSAGAAVAAARHTFAGGELGLAFRPRADTRVALAVAGGAIRGRAALRVQITAQFLVSPAARRGVGLYSGLGVAFSARRDSSSAGYLAVLVGIEGRPGQPRGWENWYLELGLGGGTRFAAGWRVRWFPRWWTTR